MLDFFGRQPRTVLLYPLEKISCLCSVVSGEFRTSLFLIEMLSTLQSLHPREVFLLGYIPKSLIRFKETPSKALLGPRAGQIACLCLLSSLFQGYVEKTIKTLQQNTRDYVGTVACDVLNHHFLLLSTEKAAVINHRHSLFFFYHLQSSLVSLFMQCLFSPPLISRSESCEYPTAVSHF